MAMVAGITDKPTKITGRMSVDARRENVRGISCPKAGDSGSLTANNQSFSPSLVLKELKLC